MNFVHQSARLSRSKRRFIQQFQRGFFLRLPLRANLFFAKDARCAAFEPSDATVVVFDLAPEDVEAVRVNFIQARGAIGSIGTVMYRVFVEGARKVGIELGVPGDAPDAALVDSVWSAIDKVALRGTTLQDMSRAGLDFTVGQKGSAAAAVDSSMGSRMGGGQPCAVLCCYCRWPEASFSGTAFGFMNVARSR